jgi:ATP/maltotriose-dependent transcriptional regulator MalT
MPDFIPAALFRPPSFPYPYVPREGLRSRFKNARSAKLILIEAAGGYGKSIGVAEFIHGLPAPSVWYPLEHLPRRTLPEFLWNLVKAIQTIWPEFGARSIELLESLVQFEAQLRDNAWLFSGLLPGLAGELNALPQAVWIVLDNYHLLHNESEFDLALTHLVEHTRAHIHFVVISRERLNWSKRALWQGQKTLIAMDEGALAFSQKEALTLASKLGLFMPPDLFKAVASRIKGQPFLHNLLVRSCRGKSTPQVSEILRVLADPAQHATDYLAKTYMQSETQVVRDFLWRTSLLKVLDPPTCDALLGTQDSQTILQRLSGDVFIEPVGSDPTQTRYTHGHEIIREFLQRALLEEYGLEEVNHLYARLGDIYQERGETDQAIESYCLGQNFREASQLVYEQARYLVNTVQLTRLSGWLKQFPQEWIQHDAVLLIYLGVIQSNEENPLARDTFLQARQLFAERGDPEGIARAMIELGWSYYIRSEYAQAQQALKTALAEPKIPPRLRARGLHYLAVTLHGSDDFPQALAYASEAIQLLRQLDTREDRAALARLFRHLSQIHESIGQIQEALSLNQEAHALASALGLGDWALGWMDFEWAENCFFSGRIEEGYIHLDEADRLLAPYRILNISAPLLDYVLITRAELVQETYDYERATALYAQVHDLPISYLALLKLAQPGAEAEALELAQAAWRQLHTHNSPVFRAKAQTRLGVALLATRDTAQARLHLEEAEATLERYGAVHALITARLYLAKLYGMLDRTEAVLDNLRFVFSQMAARGYFGLLIWQPGVIAELCAQALHAGIEPDFVERLSIKRLTAAHAAFFSPLVNDANEAVRSRATRILHGLGGPALTQARDKLSQCKNETVKKCLADWLGSGWLTDVGLLRLEQALSWRQMEVFLLWISPDIYGRTERIASETFISVDTVNTHLKDCRALLADKMGVQFPKGKGAYMAAYDWAIRNGIVNPQAPRTAA